MARKSWDQLSENYRKRLIRKGITPQQHAAGVSLKKARGHDEKTKLNDWVTSFAQFYGREPGDVWEAIREYGFDRVYKASRLQIKMQDAYHAGQLHKAHQLWLTRDTGLPNWMNFYHGYFS